MFGLFKRKKLPVAAPNEPKTFKLPAIPLGVPTYLKGGYSDSARIIIVHAVDRSGLLMVYSDVEYVNSDLTMVEDDKELVTTESFWDTTRKTYAYQPVEELPSIEVPYLNNVTTIQFDNMTPRKWYVAVKRGYGENRFLAFVRVLKYDSGIAVVQYYVGDNDSSTVSIGEDDTCINSYPVEAFTGHFKVIMSADQFGDHISLPA